MTAAIAVQGHIKISKEQRGKKSRNFRSCQFCFSDTRSRKISLQKE